MYLLSGSGTAVDNYSYQHLEQLLVYPARIWSSCSQLLSTSGKSCEYLLPGSGAAVPIYCQHLLPGSGAAVHKYRTINIQSSC